jgi:hypothetical protein
MAIWAVIGSIIKAIGTQALKAAAGNAMSHMGGLGTALGAMQSGSSEPLENPDREVANIGGRSVKFSDTIQGQKAAQNNMGGVTFRDIGNFAGKMMQGGSAPSQVLPQNSPSLEESGTYKIDEGGGKVLIPSKVDNQQLTRQEAIDKYRMTNKALGKFGTDYEAEEYLKKLRQHRNVYGG